MTSMQPYEVAMKYLGVPFRHRGRSRPSRTYTGAMDCLGLLVVVALDMELEVFDKKVYGREPWRDGLRAGLRQHCGPPIKRTLAPNDILLMAPPREKEPSHVGIVAPYPPGGLGIIHTMASIGRVCYHRLDVTRTRQIVEAYAWPAKP